MQSVNKVFHAEEIPCEGEKEREREREGGREGKKAGGEERERERMKTMAGTSYKYILSNSTDKVYPRRSPLMSNKTNKGFFRVQIDPSKG